MLRSFRVTLLPTDTPPFVDDTKDPISIYPEGFQNASLAASPNR